MKEILLKLHALRSPQSDYVFYNPTTNKPMDNIAKCFSRTLVKANLGQTTYHKRFRIHDLRATGATKMAINRVPREIREKIMNHCQKKPTSMADRYVRPDDEMRLEALNELGEQIRGMCIRNNLSFFAERFNQEQEAEQFRSYVETFQHLH